MKELRTVKEHKEVEIEEKRSQFIANIFYVERAQEAMEKIKEIRKKYYDARHHCYAYVVQEETLVKKASDDGEPSGTAGSPILNVIEKNGLTNVLIVVTRYFGGILLGAGGLVRAYTGAATEAIKTSEIVAQEAGLVAIVTVAYSEIEKFKYYCNQNKIRIVKQEYLENIKCEIELTEEEKEKLLEEQKNKEGRVTILEFEEEERKYIRK